MNLYSYDGTFEGLLTVVFETYERKAWPTAIEQKHLAQPGFFGETVHVIADEHKANRVWKGLQQKLSINALRELYHTYLWEQPGFEMIIFHFIKLVFDSNVSIEGNYAASCVLQVQQAAKQVHREKHRMEAFVRFQKTTDDLFYAHIEPDFNVVPLIITHFHKRYADQRWVIYDTKRRYGAYYDLQNVNFITLDEVSAGSNKETRIDNAADEELYKKLWQVYFDFVNIPERRNPKLHLRHMPKRYWKYLSEKQPRNLESNDSTTAFVK
jgi:probable DNA metabolism protein